MFQNLVSESKNIKITKNQINSKKGLNLSEVEKTEKDKEENLVKKTCELLKITYKELAIKTGIAEQTLRNWGAGQKIPTWGSQYLQILSEYETQKSTISLFKEFTNRVTMLSS